MPIYEYQCQGCGQRLEVKQKLSDAPLTTCERCGGTLSKLISAPGIMFKGSGWYITDYSDKMKPPSEGTGDKPAASGSAADSKAGNAPAPAGTTPATPAAPSTAPSPSPTPPASAKPASSGST